MLILNRPINILFLISQSAAGVGKKKTELPINGYIVAVHEVDKYFEAVK